MLAPRACLPGMSTHLRLAQYQLSNLLVGELLQNKGLVNKEVFWLSWERAEGVVLGLEDPWYSRDSDSMSGASAEISVEKFF